MRASASPKRMYIDNTDDEDTDDHYHNCEDEDDDDSRARCEHSPRVGPSGAQGGTDSGDDESREARVRERLSPQPPSGGREGAPDEGRVDGSPGLPKVQPTPFSVVDILSPSKFTGSGASRNRVWHPWGDRPSPGAIRSGDSDSGRLCVCVSARVCVCDRYYKCGCDEEVTTQKHACTFGYVVRICVCVYFVFVCNLCVCDLMSFQHEK